MLKSLIILGLAFFLLMPAITFGQNCFSYMNTEIPGEIEVSNVIINGLAIEVGDEIGVFDGDLCVGASVYEGPFPVGIAAWQQISGNPGYIPGNPILFKICDASSEDDILEAVPYLEIGDGTFGSVPFYTRAALAVGEIPPADVTHDGAINAQDIYPVQYHIIGLYPMGTLEAISADMNNDGRHTIEDIVQVINSFPDK